MRGKKNCSSAGMNEIQLPGTAAHLPYFEPLPNNERKYTFLYAHLLGFFVYLCLWLFCLCVYVCLCTNIHAWCPGARRQKICLLKLQCRIVAVTLWVLGTKPSKCSQLLSHLSFPCMFISKSFFFC